MSSLSSSSDSGELPNATLEATITERLPQRLYRLTTEDGTELIAGLSPDAQRTALRLSPGLRVQVRRTSGDPGRGIILGRLR